MDPTTSFKEEVSRLAPDLLESLKHNTEHCPICGAEEKLGHLCPRCAKILNGEDPSD